ncbi:NAD-dependent epimerase/dehydratase family protein [Flavobacterium ardleyense]|uniref:NAD-dependent epimerase/dehydratase family protein n=1 Tax=Flavobacterium ardleyense TaxID=2038737 RepID=A0ABW5Z7J8_9FLAO
MILVTGGTGLVGSHLLVQLLQDNEEVKALYRTEKQIEKVRKVFIFKNHEALFEKINWVKADITDIPSLEPAFENITKVYHCAALISFDPNDEDELRKVNIEGTANIVNCCIDFKVKKLCYVSSIAALGDTKENETIVTEETEWNPEKLHGDYAITKYGAEMEVWRGFQEGLEVVIVNPGVIFGYGFPDKGSGLLIKVVKKESSFYTKGNIGIVSVEDVTFCMIQLMRSEISGERFTLVGENVNIKDLLYYLAEILKVNPPKIYATKAITSLGWRLDWLISKIAFRKRKLTRATAKASHSKELYEAQKLTNTLGFNFQKKESYLSKIIC